MYIVYSVFDDCVIENQYIEDTAVLSIDRVSVPSRIAVDISDGTQWRGTEFTCTCFLCKFLDGIFVHILPQI